MKSTMIALAFLFSCQSFAGPDLSIHVLELTNASSEDETRIEKALELLDAVVNSDDFQQRILTMSYVVKKKTYQGFSQTSHTKESVLQNILEAKENFRGGTTGVIDLFMDMYQEENSTIGWTAPTDRFFHMNRFHHQDYSPARTAGNILHEWLHKIDYDHEGKSDNPFREHSVPYKLGYTMAELAAELESGGDPLLKELLHQQLRDGLEENCVHEGSKP
ncbi:MAG TPA: hypothetical protein VNJ01_17845 [Bacteriovoracaceae bacterium]|nr:hypothetical protein [Bacteriovoracaceae bacterium]